MRYIVAALGQLDPATASFALVPGGVRHAFRSGAPTKEWTVCGWPIEHLVTFPHLLFEPTHRDACSDCSRGLPTAGRQWRRWVPWPHPFD